MEHLDYLARVISFGQIAAAIAVLAGLVVPIGQGNIGATTVASIARQPEAKGTLTSTMFISCAVSETSAIYGLLISIILLFANPLVAKFMDAMTAVIGG